MCRVIIPAMRPALLALLALSSIAAAQSTKEYRYGVWDVAVKSDDFNGRTELLRAQQNGLGLYIRCWDEGFNIWVASDTVLVDLPDVRTGELPVVRWQVNGGALSAKQTWQRGQVGQAVFAPDSETARAVVNAMRKSNAPSLRLLIGIPTGYVEAKMANLTGFSQALKHLSCLK